MFFNDDKKNTNIDKEFGGDGKFSTIALATLNRYKLIFLGVIILQIMILVIIYSMSAKATNYLIINGDDIVNIYRGSSYVEIGYEAYNSKNEDLTNSVKIESELNTNKIGEYEITYILGDIVKTRKINVIEKPITDYTYITLKRVEDNQTNIYLNVGETYVEPGYEAYGNGKDITANVKVTGDLDPTKKGRYTLAYTVTDSNNVILSCFAL